MAKLRAFEPFDMSTIELKFDRVVEQTSTRITFTDGYNKITYVGDYYYNAGNVFGTVFGVIGWRGSTKLYDISGMDVDARTTSYLVEIGDNVQALAETFWRADLMLGSTGDDVFWGFQGADRLYGDAGNDVLYGDLGNDVLFGERGRDVLLGWDHDDRLYGGRGTDSLIGGRGADLLLGQGGNDVLRGDGGNDRLDGGLGRDKLTGGAGSDLFVFVEGFGTDRIKDFEDDKDTIRLDDGLWTGSLTKAQVVEKFAEVQRGNMVLDFGDDRLIIEGFRDLSELRDDLQIV